MKHNLFKSTVVDFFNNKLQSLNGAPKEVLPLLFKYSPRCISVCVDRFILDFLSLVYRDEVGKNVCLLYDLPKNLSSEFINVEENINRVSVLKLQSGFDSCSVVFAEEGVFNKKIFSEKRKKRKVIDKKIKHSLFIDSLDSYGYKEVSLEGHCGVGEYIVRGGIIDVCVDRVFGVYRVSFLDAEVALFLVDSSTNKIEREILSFSLFECVFEQKRSLNDFGLKKYHYKNNRFFLEGHDSPSIDLNVVLHGFESHKNYLSKNSVCLDYVINRGFVLNGVWYFPSWFNVGKKPPIKEVNDSFFNSFNCGSVYIHEDFGYCLFLGLIVNEFDDERICLKFQDGKIYLDVRYINKLSYYSAESDGFALSFLNSPGGWQRRLQTAKKQADLYVKDLIASYIIKEGVFRPPYVVDNDLVNEFVDGFYFNDTEDQKSAWLDIKKDLQKEEPLNRLVCGDVGFGKTEIAIRAAFTVALNECFVLVLAPTTILAHQLFISFDERLSVYGFKTGLVSRTNNKSKSVMEDFCCGDLSVLIGTRAVLYNKNVLKKANLFIVDEEHRFGVKDKEKIYTLNPKVDFLALSATPIPRTLQLSLSSVKSISTIQTPPIERKPINTLIANHDKNLILSYVLKEISRKGQIYYVDNSVDNLKKIRSWFVSNLPSINVAVLYGSLPNKKLISIMESFSSNKISLLLTTTIVESGVDLRRVNTIIINNAHLFGLSQLYQLRGRVGRSDRQAYALLLVPKNKKIPTVSKRRLNALLKFNSLGVGYNIALQDLEIRGSGSLFGYKQSGEFGVGFELYTKLLSRAFKEQSVSGLLYDSCFVRLFGKGLSVDFFINDVERAKYYKRLFAAKNKQDLLSLKKAVLSVFGKTDASFNNLYKERLLAILGNKLFINQIYVKSDFVYVVFDKKGSLLYSKIIDFTLNYFKPLNLDFSFQKNFKTLAFKFNSFPKDNYVIIYNYLMGCNLV